PDAYETLSKLLNRFDWDSKSSEQIQLQKTKNKCNKKDIQQLTIEWKKITVTDNANNNSFS
ncbi:16073_t:CDS:2, partial [Gigaspora rosea]